MLAACSSGGGNGNGNGSNSSSSAVYGAGITSVVNPSTHKGGTLTFDWRSAPDSFDPGNTYFAADWDFARFYSQARSGHASRLTSAFPVERATGIEPA
jgi:peptide/nickel transport system substrate-binding protein